MWKYCFAARGNYVEVKEEASFCQEALSIAIKSFAASCGIHNQSQTFLGGHYLWQGSVPVQLPCIVRGHYLLSL